MIYSIRVAGKPIAWRRPDLFVNVGPAGAIWADLQKAAHPNDMRRRIFKHVSAGVRPTKNEHPITAFKQVIRLAAKTRMAGRGPIDGPVGLFIHFRMPRPKAETFKTKPNPAHPHIKKPDLDNLTKGIKDAMNGVAYHDDSQVAILVGRKTTCAGGELPATLIRWANVTDSDFDQLWRWNMAPMEKEHGLFTDEN